MNLSKLYTTISGQQLSPLTKIDNDTYSACIEDIGGQLHVLYYDSQGNCEDGKEYNILL